MSIISFDWFFVASQQQQHRQRQRQQQERFLASVIRRIHCILIIIGILLVAMMMISKTTSCSSLISVSVSSSSTRRVARLFEEATKVATTTSTTSPQRPYRSPKMCCSILSFSTFSNPPPNDDENNVLLLDPLIVCGPSGVGKGTIIERFMHSKNNYNNNSTGGGGGGSTCTRTLSQQFGFCVSHTTRRPRPGEVDGVHYHFVDVMEMERLLQPQQQQQAFFLESARVHGNYYGTSWQALRAVQEQGMKCLLDIDVQGVQRIKAIQQQQQKQSLQQQSWTSQANDNVMMTTTMMMRLAPKYIFIAPPGLEILQERLTARNTETEESLRQRLANAAAEVAYGTERTMTTEASQNGGGSGNGSSNNFDAVIVNNDLDQAVYDFEEAIRRLYDL
jgi:guanylate kinase